MMKTFKKALAIMMTFIFVISLVPNFVFAESSEGTKLELKNHVWIYDSTGKRDNVQPYGSYIRVGTAAHGYKGFFQIDFSGYEYLLTDDDSKLDFYLTRYSSYSLYDFNAYILDDKNDVYGDNYVPYAAASGTAGTDDYVPAQGFTCNELYKYVTAINSKDDVADIEPFISRVDSAAAGSVQVTANKQVLLEALNNSTDDSIVTIQFIDGGLGSGKADRGGKVSVLMGSTNSYVTINSAGENATPSGYLDDIKRELTWDKFSSEPQNFVMSDLNLPVKYKGVDIEWTSTVPERVSSSGEVVINSDAYTNVTLTANLSYTPYEGKAETDTKEFSIRLGKEFYDYGSGTGTYYDGSEDAFIGTSSVTSNTTHLSKYYLVSGISGKLESDYCYEIRDNEFNNQRFNAQMIASDYTLRDTLEFSICIPTGCYGINTTFSLWKELNTEDHGTGSSDFSFYNDGVYLGSRKLFSWDGNKWHHVAVVAPGIISSDASGITYDTNLRMYVDGVLRYIKDINAETNAYPAPYGMRYCQIDGYCPMEDYDTTTKEFSSVAGYLDNLRTTNDIYVPQYNTKSSVVTNYDIDNNGETITVVTSGTTAGDVINSLTIDEDAVARMYDSEWDLLEDTAVVADGCTLVVADTNGTTSERSYAYYEIRVIETGEYAFDLPYITVENGRAKGNVKLFNYSGESKAYKVYLAVYSDGELVGLDVENVDFAAEDKTTSIFATPEINFADDNTAKLFVWKNDGIKPELVATVK